MVINHHERMAINSRPHSWLFIVHSDDWAGKIVLASYGTATMSLSLYV
jgi:hypothetical protein